MPYLDGIIVWHEEDAPYRRAAPPGSEVDERRQDRHRNRQARTGGTRAAGGLRAAARPSREGAESGRRSSPARNTRSEEALGGLMVLVDTSVWIRFLSNRAPYASELERLLSRGEVSGHDFVLGELLMGDKGGRQKLLVGLRADASRRGRAASRGGRVRAPSSAARARHRLGRCAPPGVRRCRSRDPVDGRPRLASAATKLKINYQVTPKSSCFHIEGYQRRIDC